jgi:hypothetical protein
MSRRFNFIVLALAAVGLLVTANGCVVTSTAAPPPDTEIAFDPSMNFYAPTGAGCGAGLNYYVISLAGEPTQQYDCSETAIFTGLQANATYDLDIQGYANSGALCWSGACAVPLDPGAYGQRNFADCSAEIPFTCH